VGVLGVLEVWMFVFRTGKTLKTGQKLVDLLFLRLEFKARMWYDIFASVWGQYARPPV
jgi:hypothetical protein